MTFQTYDEIRSPFNRDHATNRLIPLDWSTDEFAHLAMIDWLWTEKLDGTNVRIRWDGTSLSIAGRTDNATLHPSLIAHITDRLTPERMATTFDRETGDGGVILFGEGIGPSIQKSGGLYCDSPRFVLFDVKVGPWWLKRDSVDKVAASLGIDAVPIVMNSHVEHAIEYVRTGPLSIYGGGRLAMEGIVGRPSCFLLSRDGKPIRMKIKARDFPPLGGQDG